MERMADWFFGVGKLQTQAEKDEIVQNKFRRWYVTSHLITKSWEASCVCGLAGSLFILAITRRPINSPNLLFYAGFPAITSSLMMSGMGYFNTIRNFTPEELQDRMTRIDANKQTNELDEAAINGGIAMCAGSMILNAFRPMPASPNSFSYIPRTVGAGALGTVIGMFFSMATSNVSFTLVDNEFKNSAVGGISEEPLNGCDDVVLNEGEWVSKEL